MPNLSPQAPSAYLSLCQQLQQCAGVCAAGGLHFATVAPYCSPAQREQIDRQVPHASGVMVCLFPYAAPAVPHSNLSKYARGVDYHTVITQALQPFADALTTTFPAYQHRVLVDASPLPEVTIAALCQLGKRGENGLLLHETYGSAVFIGTILTDNPHLFPVDTLPQASPTVQPCLQCGACKRACPVQLDHSRCLSALTQQKGDLTPNEQALLAAHPLVWGCDACQDCCPHNAQVPVCNNPQFTQNLCTQLTLQDVQGHTRKQFQAAFANRAFTWRGPAPLVRNLLLQQHRKSSQKDCNSSAEVL